LPFNIGGSLSDRWQQRVHAAQECVRVSGMLVEGFEGGGHGGPLVC
jgi:hypothetical protein